jgi:hypothetical protein
LESIPKWVTFLLAFDVDYRKRRLRFLIEGQNRLPFLQDPEKFETFDVSSIASLKSRFYECYEGLEQREATTVLNPETRDLIETIFQIGPSSAQVREVGNYAQSFAQRHRDKIDLLIEQLSSDIDLKASTCDIDILLAEARGLLPRMMNEVLVNYLGFAFWDVMTFPLMPWREAREFNEIRVDRISAEDAREVNKLGSYPLKGAAFNQGAAFLSRAYRENDYLLGRLHAIDRLIDMVANAAGGAFQAGRSISAIKKRGFLRILEVEEPHLPSCAKLITNIRSALS